MRSRGIPTEVSSRYYPDDLEESTIYKVYPQKTGAAIVPSPAQPGMLQGDNGIIVVITSRGPNIKI